MYNIYALIDNCHIYHKTNMYICLLICRHVHVRRSEYLFVGFRYYCQLEPFLVSFAYIRTCICISEDTYTHKYKLIFILAYACMHIQNIFLNVNKYTCIHIYTYPEGVQSVHYSLSPFHHHHYHRSLLSLATIYFHFHYFFVTIRLKKRTYKYSIMMMT
jgi:hypothetical protein